MQGREREAQVEQIGWAPSHLSFLDLQLSQARETRCRLGFEVASSDAGTCLFTSSTASVNRRFDLALPPVVWRVSLLIVDTTVCLTTLNACLSSVRKGEMNSLPAAV